MTRIFFFTHMDTRRGDGACGGQREEPGWICIGTIRIPSSSSCCPILVSVRAVLWVWWWSLPDPPPVHCPPSIATSAACSYWRGGRRSGLSETWTGQIHGGRPVRCSGLINLCLQAPAMHNFLIQRASVERLSKTRFFFSLFTVVNSTCSLSIFGIHFIFLGLYSFFSWRVDAREGVGWEVHPCVRSCLYEICIWYTILKYDNFLVKYLFLILFAPLCSL
jgi:hypothetical protein